MLPITEDVAEMFRAIIEDRNAPKVEKSIDGYSGFLFYDDNGMPLVAMHWQHRFNHMVGRYNDIYRVQMPNITPHVCRHTYCSNMAKSGMNPKTLQYLMGHSDISVTMNVYTHISFDDAEEELKRMEEFRKAQAEVEQKKEKPIKRETIEQLLENLERELSETRETEEEEERCFLNQLRYLMMNAEMAEENEWMDMESRIRRYIGNDSFRILLTSKANGERFLKCSGILLESVEGGVLYLLPEPEAERIMKEKDERFCLGVGKEHRSVMEIPEAYQEALLAREMAFIQKNPVEEYQKKCFEEKTELAQFQEKFILQVPTKRVDAMLRKMRNWYFEAAHQRVSPYQLLAVTEAICKELDLFYRVPEKQEKCPRPLQYRDADLFLNAFEEWIHVYRESLKSQTAGKEKMEEAISYIRENYAKDLNMAMVSNHICMNYSLFSTAFKEHTGVNFVNYLKEIRIAEAKRLLLQTEDKITEIAKQVGFENDKHFMKTFKTACGVSPSEFRKDYKMVSNGKGGQNE